jgi:hypothetical protein
MNNKKFKVGQEITATITGKISRISEYYDCIEVDSGQQGLVNRIDTSQGTDHITNTLVVSIGDVFQDGMTKYVAMNYGREVNIIRLNDASIAFAPDDFFDVHPDAMKIATV